MPRANRYWVPGSAFHLTHRCHNREFLLARVDDRNAYRELLRETLLQHPVSLLSYTVTSNHVHLLVTSESADAVASMMQTVQGQFAEAYNHRNKRQGAYWSDRYHATMIDDGEHLLACLRYIDLNMVRAGVVAHPKEWSWTAWHELVGERKRYRLVDRKALLARLDLGTWEEFVAYYRKAMEGALVVEEARKRDGRWTESLAVGSLAFTRRIEGQLLLNAKRKQMALDGEAGRWTLREGGKGFPLEAENAAPRAL